MQAPSFVACYRAFIVCKNFLFATSLCVAFGATLLSTPAHAENRVAQLPEGGNPTRVIEKGVICGPIALGWALDADGRTVTPPKQIADGGTRQFATRVAESVAKCADSQETITLMATGRWPQLEIGGVQFFPGEGRVELAGTGLTGVQVVSANPEVAANPSEGTRKERVESCLEPSEVERNKKKVEGCSFSTSKLLPADARLYWLPPFAQLSADSSIYDASGNRVDRDSFVLKPARIVLPSRLVTRDGVDVSHGPGVVPLAYPEAMSSVDCGSSRCELTDKNVVLRGIAGTESQITMRFRLGPRVFVRNAAGTLEQEVLVKLPLLSCPIEVVSGPILRDVTSPKMIVRMDPQCGGEAGELHWSVAGVEAEVAQVLKRKDGVFVVLVAEQVSRERVIITATRAGLDAVVVGSATHVSMPAPRPRAALELDGHGRIDFIPTNRNAIVRVGAVRDGAHFVLVPADGAYEITREGDKILVRGDEAAAGFSSLQFAYRVSGLPSELADTDLAVITESVQRQVRQASVPASFASDGNNKNPLTEFVCVDKGGKDVHLQPGKPFRIPFEGRESCRVIIHRELLKPEDGLQEVVLDVDVTGADGTPRAQAKISERMVLRPSSEPKVFWIRGGIEQFDRVVVRVSHVVDEERYVISPTLRSGLPSVQWSAIVEGGRFRLYATVAIPAGLFRVTSPSGQLRLNFGVLPLVC